MLTHPLATVLGSLRTTWARAVDVTVAIGIPVGGDQMAADLAMGFTAPRIVALGQMPCDWLQAARRVDLLASVDHGSPAKPRPTGRGRLQVRGFLGQAGPARLAALSIVCYPHFPPPA